MALTFVDGGTTRVDVGTGASIDDLSPLTVIAWVKPSAATNNRRIYMKGSTTGFVIFGHGGAGTASFNLNLDYTTTDPNSRADNQLTTGAWNYLAGTFDGTIAPKLYRGTLAALVAEVGAYAVSTAPSGTKVTDGTSSGQIGNAYDFTKGYPGDIAFLAIWNRVLSLGELQDQQFRPRVTAGCVGFWHLGFNGVAAQPDWSGNGNNGTVTGAGQTAHVPLGRPFGPADGWVPYVVAGGPPPSGARHLLSRPEGLVNAGLVHA